MIFHYLWPQLDYHMGKGENKIMRRRLANAYLSSVISISLVLLLVCVASMLLVNAKSVSDYFKENMQVSVMLKQTIDESEGLKYKEELDKQPFIRSSAFVKYVPKSSRAVSSISSILRLTSIARSLVAYAFAYSRHLRS